MLIACLHVVSLYPFQFKFLYVPADAHKIIIIIPLLCDNEVLHAGVIKLLGSGKKKTFERECRPCLILFDVQDAV